MNIKNIVFLERMVFFSFAFWISNKNALESMNHYNSSAVLGSRKLQASSFSCSILCMHFHRALVVKGGGAGGDGGGLFIMISC